MNKKIKTILFVIFFILLFFCSPIYADLTINLIAVNPSETEVRDIEVKYFIPEELHPEDIVDMGPLKLDYDIEKDAYFVHNVIKFEPKESKTFKIKVKDVWAISSNEIDILKKQLDENLKLLEGIDNYDKALQARDQLTQKLEYIMSQQTNYSENIGRRIEQYRAYVDMLEGIKDDIYNLESLENLSEYIDEIDRSKTVKFIVEVSNPSEEEEKTVNQKHFLPKEVREEDVIVKHGFEVRYDKDKGVPYLAKEETFAPAETKRYEFVIVDIWNLPPAKVSALEDRANVAMEELSGSIYEESSKYLFDSVVENISEIKESQLAEKTIKQHIGIYRVNTNRFSDAENDLARIERMMSIIKAKRLEKLEGSRVQNVLQRLKALRGIQAISDALFKQGISVTMTWKIIFGTIIFVALFTGMHFIVWMKRSKTMGEELGLQDGSAIKEVPKPGADEAEQEEEGIVV